MSRQREKWESDDKHYLYREYLRVLAVHRPPVFVMENVKGLLSTSINGHNVFEQIIADLHDPDRAVRASPSRGGQGSKYRLFPLVGQQDQERLFDEDGHEPSTFVVCSEKHGIPQTRHRVIILGVREDIHAKPSQASTILGSPGSVAGDR